MAACQAVLERARTLGFLGPGPVEDHITHARAMGRVLQHHLTGPVASGLDLGAGGGVPGLVLTEMGIAGRWTLVDSMERRTRFLTSAVEELGLGGRVEVVRARAEELGHEAAWRSSQEVVVARGFGPPAVTAECAAPLLRAGGLLVVAEPPEAAASEGRWPPEGLALLGLELIAVEGDGARFAVIRATVPVGERYARRVGIPGKRPLF